MWFDGAEKVFIAYLAFWTALVAGVAFSAGAYLF